MATSWGLGPYATIPYGGATTGTVYLAAALAISTREVDVTVSGLVQDNSEFLAGDALNPATWQVKRLDTGAAFHPVSVAQVGTFKYRVMCLEEFGAASVTHEVSSSTLKDAGGSTIVAPRSATFVGVLDEDKLNASAILAKRRVASRDLANAQTPLDPFAGGTLQVDADGDYRTVTGAELVRKLIIRRLITKPGDFFHLPAYGIGFRIKEPLPASDLGRLKAEIERQALLEPEVEAASASLLLQSGGILNVNVRAKLRQTGEEVDVAFVPKDAGIVI